MGDRLPAAFIGHHGHLLAVVAAARQRRPNGAAPTIRHAPDERDIGPLEGPVRP